MDAMVVSVLTAVGGGDVLCVKQVGEFGVAKVEQWQRYLVHPPSLCLHVFLEPGASIKVLRTKRIQSL